MHHLSIHNSSKLHVSASLKLLELASNLHLLSFKATFRLPNSDSDFDSKAAVYCSAAADHSLSLDRREIGASRWLTIPRYPKVGGLLLLLLLLLLLYKTPDYIYIKRLAFEETLI